MSFLCPMLTSAFYDRSKSTNSTLPRSQAIYNAVIPFVASTQLTFAPFEINNSMISLESFRHAMYNGDTPPAEIVTSALFLSSSSTIFVYPFSMAVNNAVVPLTL